MARRVFFSFHYEADVWRAWQVRNSWLTHPDREAAGFWDAAAWEQVRRQGDDAIKRWIRDQLDGTSVTAVLIGAETARRPYVQYEIQQSHERGNGLLGVYVDGCRDTSHRPSARGPNPFDYVEVAGVTGRVPLSRIYPTYDWVSDDGYHSVATWVERAARQANR